MTPAQRRTESRIPADLAGPVKVGSQSVLRRLMRDSRPPGDLRQCGSADCGKSGRLRSGTNHGSDVPSRLAKLLAGVEHDDGLQGPSVRIVGLP